MTSSVQYKKLQQESPLYLNEQDPPPLPKEAADLINQTAIDLNPSEANVSEVANLFAKKFVELITMVDDPSCLTSFADLMDKKQLHKNRTFSRTALRAIGPIGTKSSPHKKLSPERLSIISRVTFALATP